LGICHDPKVGRITIAKARCEQLPQLPQLKEVLARYATRCFLDIELKVAGLESELLLALREHPPTRGCVVSSFLPEVLKELRVRNATLPLGFICDSRRQLQSWQSLPVDYVLPESSLVTRTLVDAVHAEGKQIVTWTVNDKRSMLRLAGWGVDGIISDNPKLLAQTFPAARKHS